MTNIPGQPNDATQALASTARLARFQVYDSFGNHVAESTAGVGLRGSFAWRGQEGSATDAGTTLVYMQNRHYDPELGRFVQADDLLMASMTTQGMNRYVYTENDPVNLSDPSGRHPVVVAIVLLLVSALWAGLKQLLKKKPFRCFLRAALGDVFLNLLEFVTSFGFYGWLGIALIIAGLAVALYPFGFIIGGLISFIGFMFVLFDRAYNALVGLVIDYLFFSDRQDARSKELLARILQSYLMRRRLA